MTEAPLSATDPVAAQGAVQAAFEEAQTEFPDAPVPAPDVVDLPGGLVSGEHVYKTVKVRELNGEDEEKLFRALGAKNPFHFLNTVLECGVEKIGDLNAYDTRKLLPEMLIGDREAVMLGIRCATYDDTVDIVQWPCPECDEPMDLTLNLQQDVEVKKLKDPERDIMFTVKLRRGGTALLRLPTGADQAIVGDKPERTIAERNTLLLQRCVIEVDQPDGKKIMIPGFPSYILGMGIKDRRTLLEEISKRSPGPQYNAIKFTHDSCGKEVTLALSLADLFLG